MLVKEVPSESINVWSSACTLIELASGQHLFSATGPGRQQTLEVMSQIDEGAVFMSDNILKTWRRTSPKKVRNAAPIGDELAWRCLLTVRGRSGAVLLLHLLVSEASEHIAAALWENFEPQHPSKLFEEAEDVCRNLGAACLEPVLLAIVYESAQCNKRLIPAYTIRTEHDGSPGLLRMNAR